MQITARARILELRIQEAKTDEERAALTAQLREFARQHPETLRETR